MALLSLKDISLQMGGRPLLDKAILHIEQGERVCIVGRNGTGKSCLLRIMAGELHADSGEVARAQGTRFGYMPQEVPPGLEGSIYEVLAGGLGAEGAALAAYHRLEAGLADDGAPAAEPVSDDRLDAARQRLDNGNGWELHGDILSVLNHLRLDPDTSFAPLSGGMKRRVLLARALVASTDLILDEPTNHLDIDAIAWLEDFLQRRARTLVFVTHDRAFLARLATRIVELDRGQLYSYDCGYDAYLAQREERFEVEAKQNHNFDRKLAQEEAWIRQGVKARRTRNMGRVRALRELRSERSQRQEKVGIATMQVQEAERSGKLVIEAKNVTYAHGDAAPVIDGFSGLIQRGDRIGLIGPNGVGKTTLLRLLLGEIEPQQGSIRHGTRLEVAYFDQMREGLDLARNAMDNVAEGAERVDVGGRNRHVVGYLRDFLFDDERMRLPVHMLSGGERNRLLMARLFLKPSNVLVLDEPTNDLDVETLELLEDLLGDYAGTVLLVSHDRAFLDNVVTSTLALEGEGAVREYVGGYEDWLRQRPAVPLAGRDAGRDAPAGGKPQPLGTGDPAQTAAQADATCPEPGKPRKLTFKEQRELELLREEIRQLPDRISALEEEQAALEARLADPAVGADVAAVTAAGERLAALEEELHTLLERWEAAEQREALLAACRQ